VRENWLQSPTLIGVREKLSRFSITSPYHCKYWKPDAVKQLLFTSKNCARFTRTSASKILLVTNQILQSYHINEDDSITTRRLTKSERAPAKVSKLALFLLSHKKFQWSRTFKECVFHAMCLSSKRRSNIKVKVMVSNERSCQKEYISEIWKR
jgi:hypothetical protein